MSTAVAEQDLEVLEDTLDRKGWRPVTRVQRERGFELMLAWELGRWSM